MLQRRTTKGFPLFKVEPLVRYEFRNTLKFATYPLRHFLRKCHLPFPRGARQEEAFGRLSADSYCLTDFERRAFLSQILNRNCLQICCTVAGGAYHNARKVSSCVRNNYKIGACLNCTRRMHQTATQRPFSPLSFPARRKRLGRRRPPIKNPGAVSTKRPRRGSVQNSG